MEALSPQQRSDVLVDYQRRRAIGLRLNAKLVKSLKKEDIDEAGNCLGILRKGVLCFDTEDTVAVLMDYAIRHIRRDGRSAIERYLDETPPTDREEAAWLQAVSQARYRILQVEEVYPGFGLRVCDIFRDETNLLVDVGFSRTAALRSVLASYICAFGDYWVTTGAALPVTADVLKRLVSEFERRFSRKPDNYGMLSQERETELATLAIRLCLAGGMSLRVSYGETPRAPHFHRPMASAPTRRQIGRNAPCPCRSGRKFKICCLR